MKVSLICDIECELKAFLLRKHLLRVRFGVIRLQEVVVARPDVNVSVSESDSNQLHGPAGVFGLGDAINRHSQIGAIGEKLSVTLTLGSANLSMKALNVPELGVSLLPD